MGRLTAPYMWSTFVGLQPCRFILLALLIYALFGTWTLEQPSTSLMFRHRRFQWMIKRLRVSWLSFIFPDIVEPFQKKYIYIYFYCMPSNSKGFIYMYTCFLYIIGISENMGAPSFQCWLDEKRFGAPLLGIPILKKILFYKCPGLLFVTLL